jgi:hypothetical protein
MENGAAVAGLLTEMASVLETMEGREELALFREELTVAIQGLAESSTWLGARLVEGDIQSALAGASPYLRQFGLVLGGWLMAVAAVTALGGAPGFDPTFLNGKVNTARFYGEQLLPAANGLVPAVKGGAGVLESASF